MALKSKHVKELNAERIYKPHAHCLMDVKMMSALMQNIVITPRELVFAAEACRCLRCNEALARYAEIMLRKRFGGK